ncbi:MAG: hypothetical protein ACMG6S_05860 [Byssovorax sp.]
MQRFQETDGTEPHRKGIRFHAGKLLGVESPLHKTLRVEALSAYGTLKSAERARADSVDDEAEARAWGDTSEIAFENGIRGLDSALVELDRDHPGRGARGAVFPRGFGEVIEPDGEAQLAVLPAFHVRLAPFKQEPALQTALAKLDNAESAFRKALVEEDAAVTATAAAFAAEIAARAGVRHQIESAYGRLRDFYKTQPAEAERFFVKLGRREGKAKAKSPSGPAASGAPGAAGATSGTSATSATSATGPSTVDGPTGAVEPTPADRTK